MKENVRHTVYLENPGRYGRIRRRKRERKSSSIRAGRRRYGGDTEVKRRNRYASSEVEMLK